MAVIGGFFAYVFRMQLAFPGIERARLGCRFRPPTTIRSITNHGTIMIFWVAMPVLIAAFGNYLIPLMIGADDMVFPKINRLSAIRSFCFPRSSSLGAFFVEGGAFGGAWTAYPPLSDEGGVQPDPTWVDAYGFSPWRSNSSPFCSAGSTFITTAMNSRAPGMKMWDIPMVVWMIVIASSILFHGCRWARSWPAES